MGTQLVRSCIKEDDLDFPALPPGFEAFTTYKLKKVEDTERELSNSAPPNPSGEKPELKVVEPGLNDSTKISRSLRRRPPSINHGQCSNSDDDADFEHLDQSIPMQTSLPKGVIRGCPECKNCQKVLARYKPEAACRPSLDDAPVFYPTEEEFEDTLSYIGNIRHQAEPYGICRIVPPSSWKPPCHLKEKSVWENSMFATRIQRVDKLQNREPSRKTFTHTRKKRKCLRMGVDSGAGTGNILEPWQLEFGFEPGPEFTLDTFQRYADEFKAHYFRGLENKASTEAVLSGVPGKQPNPSIDIVEGEYWRVVERPTEEIEVLYGADLETGSFGSGFPKTIGQASSPDEQYVKSGWNLNNLPRLTGSVLTYENSDISGVQVPWLYVGMCFSSFCLHVEDHYLYSLNYMHFGAPKLWYGVPGKDATKLEEAMRKHLPDLFDEQPDLLHKLVTQLSPNILKSEGVPVYRCVQNPGEFVITFPRAYHGGFNCGFNCAEAVNVAPLDWFPHGQNAVELYRDQRRKTTISHDKLLLGAAMEAVKAHWELNFLRKNTSDNWRWKNVCGDGILAKSLRSRVSMERVRRDFLCKSAKVLKMLSDFDVNTERECSVCFFDLHLSAAGCRCSPDKYACLNHAKQLCPCAWSDKFFLFRYDIDELDLLVEAIEGKLSAVYRWARSYLGFSLSSQASEDRMKVDDLAGLLSSSQTVDMPIIEEIQQPTKQASTGASSHLASFINKRPLTDAKVTSDNITNGVVVTGKKIRIKKDVSRSSTSNAIATYPQQTLGKPEVKKSVAGQDVICLSDDEGEQLDRPLSGCMEEAASTGPSSDKKSDIPNKILAASLPVQPMGNQVIVSCHQASNGARVNGSPPGLSNSRSATQGVVIALGVQRIKKTKNGTPLQKVEPKVLDDSSTVQTLVQKAESKVLDDVQWIKKTKDETPVLKEEPKVLDDASTVHTPEQKAEPKVLDDASTVQTPIQKAEPKVLDDASTVQTPVQKIEPEVLDDASTSQTPVQKVEPKVLDDASTVHGSLYCVQKSSDMHHHQKGPRIAKVVRRINCNVEPLEFGSVVSGKLWSNSRAIFPKGFKSRVRYINVLDPSNMCHYISEVLDSGAKGPLFMVSLENRPSEVFVHVMLTRCWEMVRERVNQEISKQHKLGKRKLPPLQPPGSLDGYEMFGFTSPAIIQVLEAFDRNRVCTGYWESRPIARASQNLHSDESSRTPLMSEDTNSADADTILRGLFKKANSEELRVLLGTLGNDKPAMDSGFVTKLLKDEINKRVG